MKVPTRASKCCLDETSLEPGSRYLSVLTEEKERCDYCEACGLKQNPKGYFWWGVIPNTQKEHVPINERLLGRLRLLVETKPALAYLLAQYLVRQEMMVKRGKSHFEVPLTGETFALKSLLVAEEEAKELTELITLES